MRGPAIERAGIHMGAIAAMVIEQGSQ